jgi:hypothetical protein
MIVNGKEMKECPDCGYDEYYVICRMSGIGECHSRFDGGEADNTHLHDPLTYTENKTAYCGDCRKRLGIIEDK